MLAPAHSPWNIERLFVSTSPQQRRGGIGAAITLAALRAVRDLGLRVGVLGALVLGYPLYRRLGFMEHCRLALYEWQPIVV